MIEPSVPKKMNPISVFNRIWSNQVVMMDQSGQPEFPTTGQLENLAPVTDALDTSVDALLRIHKGQQGKHIEGHNDYIKGRSEITHSDPETLLKRGAGTGEMIGPKTEAVDFNEPIGIYRQEG